MPDCRCAVKKASLVVALLWRFASPVGAQGVSPASVPAAANPPQTIGTPDTVLVQIERLERALDAVREQLDLSQRESEELRRQLQTVREEMDAVRRASSAQVGRGAQAPDANDRLAALEQEQELLSAKVDDQEQTKVESGSKYHVRLSGLALVNVVSTRGSVDSLDLPTVALPRSPDESGGTFGATVRQSFLSLEAFGPTIGGARMSGSLKLDFFGGFPRTSDGFSSGLVRLRTAALKAEWQDTSIVAGQEVPFFSPLSPTSLASSAYPALASSGNLWVWTPQVHVEHRVTLVNDSKVVIQGGILDPFTGELPTSEYSRGATAGERSRVPAAAVRAGWQQTVNERVLAAGAGAYYSRQDWGYSRIVGAWAATADWELPLARWLTLSGELYRGRAIGGLGGGASTSVLFDLTATGGASAVLALDSVGGWSQLKLKPASRFEFNAAFGGDHSSRSDVDGLLNAQRVDGSPVGRNASGFLNGIFLARSNILFSVEYRRLWTASFNELRRTADHVSFTGGIAF